MSMFALQGQLVRHECRACKNICFTPLGPKVPDEGYRCEACENANYERHDFDKSLPSPEAAIVEPVEPTPPTDPNEPTDSTDSEARPSDEPKSGATEGEVVQVGASAPEAE